jgi:hypothetical protein
LRADVIAFLRQHWNGKVPAWNNDSRGLLEQLVADGWTRDRILRGMAEVTPTPTSASALLTAHLRRLLTKHHPDDFPEPTETPAPARTLADPLAEENQKAVAVFCKWSGADRGALSRALAEFIADGYEVRAELDVDDYSQLHIEHADLGDGWQVYWEAFQGVDDCGEPVTCNEIRAGFDSLPPTDQDRLALSNLNAQTESGRGWDLSILTRRPTIAALREFVNVTGPIALAAHKRLSQAQPKPAKATPTAPPAADVLASDHRQPGPDGFGTFDPPNRAEFRPRGHDQAVREADQAEKLRQAQALADADPQVAAALAALQASPITDDGQASA